MRGQCFSRVELEFDGRGKGRWKKRGSMGV